MTAVKVVVTGIGLISPLALTAGEHFQRFLRGESGAAVSEVAQYRNYPYRLEARVRAFPRPEHISSRMLRKLLSPSAGYAVGAAGQAIGDAGLERGGAALQECGLYVGSISLDIEPELFIPPLKASLNREGEFEIGLFATRGMRLLDPLFLVKALPNAGVCGISVEHQVLGPNTNVTNGPISGLQAVVLAADAIRRGEISCALAGGYDTMLGMDSVAEHLIAGRLTGRHERPELACRPFDVERDGYVLGEGAAFFFLEAAGAARARGARVYGEIAGAGQTSDASLLQRNQAGDGAALAQAARQALQDAAVAPGEIEMFFGDGLATKADDWREAAVRHGLDGARDAPYSAATSATGFTGAASGAFSLAHALLALHEQVAPPLANCLKPDPRCAVPFLTQAEARPLRRALVWNSERGLKNMAVVVLAAT